MGLAAPLPEPSIYRAFTITPTSTSTEADSKPSWSNPTVKESNFPQSSLIAELSSLQDKDKSSIADKIARLSGEQRAAVYNVLVDLVGDGESGNGKEKEMEEEGMKLEWSVCEAVRVRDSKAKRTRCVRVFFVRAPVIVSEMSGVGSEISSRGGKGKESEVSSRGGKGKGKEKAESRSRSRGKEKAIEDSPKEKRKSGKELERRESKGKGKEIERVDEKKSRRRSTKSRHRKKESTVADDSDDNSCYYSDSTISIQNPNLRRSNQRTLSQRFRSKPSEINPMAYGRAEPPRWEKPVITPPQFPNRGYQPSSPNEYHIRAAYEAGQRDALAERMRNAALDRGAMPQGPSHVISFERLRPGFEEWSEESYSQGSQEPERYVSDRRPPIVQYPRHVNPNHIPPSYVGTQYGREPYLDARHIDRRYSEDTRMDSSYEQYRPNTFQRRYTAW
ncbi:hypothetical protein V8E51_001027 [Hyaloscypha variabilis]